MQCVVFGAIFHQKDTSLGRCRVGLQPSFNFFPSFCTSLSCLKKATNTHYSNDSTY